mgnify:CR=1 FL=1
MEKPAVKVYVQVEVSFDDMGRMHPRRILWEDGRSYEVDRVLDMRPASAARAGGQGDRYTVRLHGRETYLFFEHSPDPCDPITGRWFVERREGQI